MFVLLALLVAAYLVLPRVEFIANLIFAVVGVVATVWVLDSFLQQREVKKFAPLRKAAMHESFKAYLPLQNLWQCLFFDLIKSPEGRRVQADFDAVVASSKFLDLNSVSTSISPERQVGFLLIWQFEKFSTSLDRMLARFGDQLPPSLVASGQRLERCSLAQFASTSRIVREMQGGSFGQWRIPPNDLLEFLSLLELFREELRAFSKSCHIQDLNDGLEMPIGREQHKVYLQANEIRG